MRHVLLEARLDSQVEVDSAGGHDQLAVDAGGLGRAATGEELEGR